MDSLKQDLKQLEGRVLSLEREREADRAENTKAHEDIRDQIKRWGREFTGEFESMRQLLLEIKENTNGTK